MVPDANELFRAFGVGDELTPPSLPPRPPGSNPNTMPNAAAFKRDQNPSVSSLPFQSQHPLRSSSSPQYDNPFERQRRPYNIPQQQEPVRKQSPQLVHHESLRTSVPSNKPSEAYLPASSYYQPANSAPFNAKSYGNTSQNAVPASGSWGPLFYTNGSATSLLRELLAAVFQCLDRQGMGYIRPEDYSLFLAAIDWPVTLNCWKAAMEPMFGYTPEDRADMGFVNILRAFGIEHTCAKRHAKIPPASYGMPLITRKGFVDLFAFEFASEPQLAPRCVNKAIEVYGLGQGRGPIAREFFLQSKPHEIAERERIASQHMQAEGTDQLQAARNYAHFDQLGRRYCDELLSPYVYVRGPYAYNRSNDLI